MKKVSFSDKVDVREMSIDRAQHVSEVKNPKNFIVGTPPPKIENTPQTSSSLGGYGKWIYVAIFIVMCIVAYFVWKKYTSSK
jgi:hypothetical protein